MNHLRDKLHQYTELWNLACEVLESIIAIIVTIAIVISIISLIPGIGELAASGHAYAFFTEYLEELFSCVIGIEFLKMLCHPNSDNTLETLIFLVARHMIISETTPMDNLISVVTIILLVLVRRILSTDPKLPSILHRFSKSREEEES